MLELFEILPVRYAFLVPILNSIGYFIKHRTKLNNTLIPSILFAIALASGILIRGFETNNEGWLYWLDVVVYHGLINGIKTTIYACGGYETVRALYFHYKNKTVENNGVKKKMSDRTKRLISILVGFLLASVIFCVLSVLFGAGVFGTFAKLTDGFIFGILVMMCYDLASRLIQRKETITKVYVAMQILLLVNVSAFAMASVTTNRMFSIAGLAVFVLTGVCAGVLPYVVDYIKNRRSSSAIVNQKELSADAIQAEWVKQRSKILAASKKETRVKMLRRCLAYCLVGDSIYGALDLEQPFIVYTDTDGVSYALSVESALDKGYSESNTEVANAITYIDVISEIGE